MPPNLINEQTLANQQQTKAPQRVKEFEESRNLKRGTTYAQSFYQPNPQLAADTKQSEGMKQITSDLKTLGFRRKLHEGTCKQKSFELSKTAVFQSSFNTNCKKEFVSSFDQGY
mmetsp:Transcript_17867/g.30350  ORF Transcript_17867/g.30350 Transcript_17867/m.30350 type:complete len:114 (+) Transcript_17867:465-806(+)